MKHFSVLKNEVLEALNLESGAVIDCTLGYGGHTLSLLEQNPNIHIYAFDRDENALSLAKQRLAPYASRLHIRHSAFANALDLLGNEQLAQVKGILADIGVSSMQLDDKHRGFSFTSNNLDMRMDSTQNLNAAKVINTYSAMRLEEIFRIYGEIRQSKKLTEIIVSAREKKPFESALELSELIERHFPRIGGIHPATLAFQALRIEVNGELEQLQTLLQSIESAFINGVLYDCKVAIISFHSLEDRIIKQTFKQWAKSCKCEENALKCECGNNNALGSILTKKPILPSETEIIQNKRSRSAKLRIFQLGAKI
ncbi:16S rRNA (cytosine(1402)-N(4))-methyltransferase RsmH [Helicobacter magdeburgensis]|uniref:Ribosomal RNA small subunit methyltransferase H n=1 Tax=Helicobacter magdeburgensis TaxID=471858 RepID=A0A4U8SY48_9HELI|nr:16S rRNA (cytosine(1402)-N(4))-methyltransferase RsmH [Helicobacter magdeburgensis]TLD91934.1 16S rRNA (cytosine(1402)-N(4))-methyltransferase RsmH [Helicobacter magdeburgensis]